MDLAKSIDQKLRKRKLQTWTGVQIKHFAVYQMEFAQFTLCPFPVITTLKLTSNQIELTFPTKANALKFTLYHKKI